MAFEKPFGNWSEMLAHIRNVMDQNGDVCLVIDGREGSGKSTLAMTLAGWIDPKWHPDNGLIWDEDDFWLIYKSNERGRVFVIDEAVSVAFSRESMSGTNKKIVKLLQTARILNHTMIFVSPNLHWMDLYIRNHRATIRGHCKSEFGPWGIRRGEAVFEWRHWSKYTGESYWKELFGVRFGAIPPGKTWKAYDALKLNKVQKMVEEFKLEGEANPSLRDGLNNEGY